MADARKERAQRVAITQDRVLQELARIAFSDMRELFDESGTLRQPHAWPDDDAVATAPLRYVVRRGRNSLRVAIRMHDKVRALEMLAKHLGLLTEHVHLTSDAELIARLQEGRRRAMARSAGFRAAPN